MLWARLDVIPTTYFEYTIPYSAREEDGINNGGGEIRVGDTVRILGWMRCVAVLGSIAAAVSSSLSWVWIVAIILVVVILMRRHYGKRGIDGYTKIHSIVRRYIGWNVFTLVGGYGIVLLLVGIGWRGNERTAIQWIDAWRRWRRKR